MSVPKNVVKLWEYIIPSIKCAGCGREASGPGSDSEDFAAYLHEQGWTVSKNDNVKCYDCKNKKI